MCGKTELMEGHMIYLRTYNTGDSCFIKLAVLPSHCGKKGILFQIPSQLKVNGLMYTNVNYASGVSIACYDHKYGH